MKSASSRPRLVVSSDGRGVVGHVGSRLLADLAEATGLESGFVEVLASLPWFRLGEDTAGDELLQLRAQALDMPWIGVGTQSPAQLLCAQRTSAAGERGNDLRIRRSDQDSWERRGIGMVLGGQGQDGFMGLDPPVAVAFGRGEGIVELDHLLAQVDDLRFGRGPAGGELLE